MPTVTMVAADGTAFTVDEAAAHFSTLVHAAVSSWKSQFRPPPGSSETDSDSETAGDFMGASAPDNEETASVLDSEVTPDALDSSAATSAPSTPSVRGPAPDADATAAAAEGGHSLGGTGAEPPDAGTDSPPPSVRRMVSVGPDSFTDALHSDGSDGDAAHAPPLPAVDTSAPGTPQTPPPPPAPVEEVVESAVAIAPERGSDADSRTPSEIDDDEIEAPEEEEEEEHEEPGKREGSNDGNDKETAVEAEAAGAAQTPTTPPASSGPAASHHHQDPTALPPLGEQVSSDSGSSFHNSHLGSPLAPPTGDPVPPALPPRSSPRTLLADDRSPRPAGSGSATPDDVGSDAPDDGDADDGAGPLPRGASAGSSAGKSGSTSPASYHQRTPCMIADDDGCGIFASPDKYAADTAAAAPAAGTNGLAAVANPKSPAEGGGTATPPVSPRSPVMKLTLRDSAAARRLVRQSTLDRTRAGDGVVLYVSGARIDEDEIRFDFDGTLRAGESQPPSAGADTGEEAQAGDRGKQRASKSRGSEERPAATGESAAPPVLPAWVLQLCVTYLEHFVEENFNKSGAPAVIPVPLSRPLAAVLSPWELTFLCEEVLGTGAAHAELMRAVFMDELQACPLDYRCPGGFLRRAPDLAAGVVVPPRALLTNRDPRPEDSAAAPEDTEGRELAPFVQPTHIYNSPAAIAARTARFRAAAGAGREGMARLAAVRRAARALGIAPLAELCTAYVAEVLVLLSYAEADPLQAAQLVRQRFGVESHWTRRETDALKIENEWPANEDDA